MCIITNTSIIAVGGGGWKLIVYKGSFNPQFFAFQAHALKTCARLSLLFYPINPNVYTNERKVMFEIRIVTGSSSSFGHGFHPQPRL